MKQRFTKRTRLVSALLTLAMVFTFLPFSAFAADIKSVDKLAFTTNGCDALQIEDGAQVSGWLASFKAKMNQTDFSRLPLVAVDGYGFSINMYVNTLSVVKEDGTIPGTFSKGTRYFLELLILPKDGYVFVPGQKFESVKVNGKEVGYESCYKPKPESTTGQGVWTRLPLSFKGNHTLIDHPKKLPNCTTPGTEYYSECTKCGKLIKEIDGIEKVVNLADLSIPALGHVADTDWSWDSTTHYFKCKRCGIPMPDETPQSHLYGSDDHTCTVCGYTWQAIEKVKVWVTEPAAGQQATSTVGVGSTANYYATCKWFYGKQEFTGTFEEGETYTLQVTVKTGYGSKYKFVNGTEYEVNGDSVGRMPMYGESYTGPWESATLSGIKYVAKSAEEGSVITNIQMTIPAPVAGNSPSSCKVQKSDPRYTIKSHRWKEVDAAGNPISHNVTTFEEGKHYQVHIRLEPNVGYEFEGGGQEAIINGKTYSSYTSEGMDPKMVIEYIVNFTAVAGGGSTGGGSTGGSTGGGSTGGGSTGGDSTIPPEAGKYQLTVTDGVATVNGITRDVLNVKPGDMVTLTADATKFPENEEFGWWEITPYGSVSNTLTGQYQRTATFTMPNENVSARAMSKSAGVSTGGDDGGGGGGAAILLVGGAAVAGLVGYGVYSYVSEQQLKALLPEGVAMPENRAQTALLLWNTAGRPEPAEAPAFKDVADPDTAKAAQWCVEHGLMDQKLGGRFAPDNSDPAYKTLNAYQQLVG